MKLNISDPKKGTQKSIEIENEDVLKFLYDKTLMSEIKGKVLSKDLDNYILKINGGQDKQGFPLKPGILTNRRVKLLLSKGTIGCRGTLFKKGERRKKSVRGCIISPEIRVLNLSVIKKINFPNTSSIFQKQSSKLKRASKIRKLYSLSKGDSLKKHIIIKLKNKNHAINKLNCPKIQRIVTPTSIQRKRLYVFKKKNILTKSKFQLIAYGKALNT